MQGSIQTNAALAGVSVAATITRTAAFAIPLAPETPLPAAKTGSLAVRTDDNTGVLAFGVEHGILNGDVVDVYWEDGLCGGMTAAVNGNDVTVDGGAGNHLPAQGTAVTIAKQVILDVPDFAGNKLQMLAVYIERRGRVEFREAAAAALVREQVAGEVFSWATGTGIVNPLADKTVVSLRVSNGDPSDTSDVRMAILVDG